jgi:hypothetical protein
METSCFATLFCKERPMNRHLGVGLTCLVGISISYPAWADGVVLVNGDILHGEVVSLDGETLQFKSKSFGELSLARGDVASVHLGDVRLDRGLPRPAPLDVAAPDMQQRGAISPPGGRAAQTPEDLLGTLTGRKPLPSTAPSDRQAPGAEDVLDQLQSGGLNPQILSEVQKALPLVNTPEVRDYFNTTVDGLMSGNLSIQDVRKDAVKARDAILDLQKDLGPGAAALNGYLSILNGFIEETTPADETGGEDGPNGANGD